MSEIKNYKSVLICAPTNITLTGFVCNAFRLHNAEVDVFDAVRSVHKLFQTTYLRTLGIKWLNHVFKPIFVFAINRNFYRLVASKTFDLVFIYNSEYISVESLKFARSKGIVLVNYLGDNPFYTSIYDEGIYGLRYFDYVLSPDKFWLKCLYSLDLQAELVYMLPGANPVFSNLGTSVIPKVVFVGSNYTNKEGFKRAALFNSISDKIVVYGGHSWLPWLDVFEDLREVYFESERMSDDHLNVLINQYKLAIVDANTGIVAGVHQRFLDISQTGCLPLVEGRYEILDEFGAFEIFFNNPVELRELIDMYLGDEKLRLDTLNKLSKEIRNKYNIKNFLDCIN